jgi:photosystem II stability/assembly factor-like uncharacterized protein
LALINLNLHEKKSIYKQMKNIYYLIFTLVITTSVNAQEWKWINPLPSGNYLNCVKFADDNIGFAVGNYGTIIKTTDGGLTWVNKISGTNLNLFSISVIDKDTIYVCGLNLSVFKTTDGGNTWINIFNGQNSSSNTNFIFFVTPAVGYVTGSDMQLYKTTDFGNTWTNIAVGYTYQAVSSLFFTTVDTGYASVGNGIGGQTLKTTDGGINWIATTVPITVDFNSIVFTDQNTGYLIGNTGSILKTTDAGYNWIIQNQSSSGLTLGNLKSIDFIDNNIGFIVGSSGDILKTTNGGNIWTLISYSNYQLSSVSFTDENNGCAVGGKTMYEESGIIKTTSGGNNWVEKSNSVTSSYINKVKFINSFVGYAVGGNTNTYSGFIIKSTNSGSTWSVLNLGINANYLSDLCVIDTNTIFVISHGGQIFKSTNAGNSWSEQIPQPTNGLYSICFLDSITGYAVGENGTILKTTNGGGAWINQISGTTMTLKSVYFKDNNNGFITAFDYVADSTLFLSTVDGGLNWNKRYIGTSYNPQKIFFVNSDTAFIAAGFGAIFKTTNGGINWNVSYHNGNDYSDIFFTDKNTGYIVGENGAILKTENCGINWYLLNSGTNKGLHSICFTDINNGVTTGANGVILKTTNGGCHLKPLNQSFFRICNGDSISIEPNVFGGVKPLSYYWHNTLQTSSITVSPSFDTIYTVTITDSDSNTIIVDLSVYVDPVPITPIINVSGDTLFSNVSYGNHWYKNDTLIYGAYDSIYIAIEPGYYYSIVSNYYCFSDTSNIIQYLGVKENVFNNTWNIFPNPTNSKITIEICKFDKISDLIITNINGQELIRQEISSAKTQIDLSHLISGIYFFKLIAEKGVITGKIVKE